MNKKKTENNVNEYLFKNAPIDLLNKIRKILITRVPVWAIDTVKIYENTTRFTDEMICNRLSMLPIFVDSKNEEEMSQIVSISGYDYFYLTPELLFDGSKINIIDEFATRKYQIIPLSKNEKIEIQLVARKGTMNIHSKWQSCWSYIRPDIDYIPKFDESDQGLLSFYHKLYDKYVLLHKDFTVYKKSILVIEQRNKYTPDQLLYYAMFWLYKCFSEKNIELDNILSNLSSNQNL